MRKPSTPVFAMALSTALLTSCSAPGTGDLYKEYLQIVRDQRVAPVYPPREEFQVGDAYFISWNPEELDDLSQIRRIYLGQLPT